jgi:hypothetical protein
VNRDLSHMAFMHCLEALPGATRRLTYVDRVAPAWDVLDDDTWTARLSDGQRTLLWVALQLYNGGGRHLRCDLASFRILDSDLRHRALEAIGMAHGEQVVVITAADRVAEHRGDPEYGG